MRKIINIHTQNIFIKIRGVMFFITAAISLFALCGCNSNIVPSQYDLKLTTNIDSLTLDVGAAPTSLPLTIDSRRYQELSSEQGIFLSYHLLSSNGDMLIFDNERTPLEAIDARGVKKELLNFTAPIESGDYLLQVDLVEENVAWFSEKGMPTITVPLEVLDTYTPPYTEIQLDSEVDCIEISAGDVATIPLIIQNAGAMPLYATGKYATLISYHIMDTSGNMLLYDGIRTNLKETLDAGVSQNVQVEISDNLFNTPGNYIISFDLVIEGMAWYSENGLETLNIPIKVK